MRQKRECDYFPLVLTGGQGAPGSNPGIPTEQKSPPAERRVAFCFYSGTRKLAFEEQRINKKAY